MFSLLFTSHTQVSTFVLYLHYTTEVEQPCRQTLLASFNLYVIIFSHNSVHKLEAKMTLPLFSFHAPVQVSSILIARNIIQKYFRDGIKRSPRWPFNSKRWSTRTKRLSGSFNLIDWHLWRRCHLSSEWWLQSYVTAAEEPSITLTECVFVLWCWMFVHSV